MKFEDIKVGETYLTTGRNEVKVLYKHEEQRTLVVEFGADKLLTFIREFETVDWKQKQTLANCMWVKHKHGSKVFITDLGKGFGFGVNYKGEWEVYNHPNGTTWIFNKYWQPMTEEEVVEFMLNEASKRGYVEGVEVKCLFDGKVENLCFKIYSSHRLFKKGELWWDTKKGSDTLIMLNGKWAEIQPDELTQKIKELQELASEQGKNVVVTIENK